MRRRPVSWSMRFALALCAVFVIGSLSAGGAAYILQSRELSRSLIGDVRMVAESLAQMERDNDRQDLTEQIVRQNAASGGNGARVAFIDARTGETIGNLRVQHPFEGARHLETGADLTLTGAVPPDLPDSFHAYGLRIKDGWVIAARDDGGILESGEILIKAMAWGLGGALLLSVALALAIARRNERRVTRMGAVLDSAGAGQLERRIRDAGDDDLAVLAAQVDRMLDRLSQGMQAIRQVSTDVAHDLRAPLGRLRMRLEPHAMDPALPDATRHEIGSALADLDGVSETFDAILRLARLQSGSVERAEAPVDLCDLARETQDILQSTAEDTDHPLTLALPTAPIIVAGDRDLLSQALINLVDNALRHCPAPAQVTITVKMRDGRPCLSVCDTGPGIADDDRARVLERFVRLDRSRGTPGTGLGLSLVAAIADLHGAEFRLSDNAPGLCASLFFHPRGARSATAMKT